MQDNCILLVGINFIQWIPLRSCTFVAVTLLVVTPAGLFGTLHGALEPLPGPTGPTTFRSNGSVWIDGYFLSLKTTDM